MQNTDPKTYSVSVRVKRTTVEYAYVPVPVTGEIMETDEMGDEVRDEKGFAHIDPEKLMRRAAEQARQPSVKWYRESEHIEPHPIQKAPEPDELMST